MGEFEWRQRAQTDGAYAIACGLMELTRAIQKLGNGNAATNMGAIEAFGKHIGEKIDLLAEAIGERTSG